MREPRHSNATGFRRTRSKQRGLALTLVVWLLLLVSAIAGSFSVTVFTETALARQRVDAAQARLLAEAGVYRAILELLRSDREQAWPVDGTPNLFRFGEDRVRVSIRDAAGLVDLNTATPETLRRLLERFGVAGEESDAVIDAWLDWRDPDELRHLNGAEDPEYRAAGRSYGTPDQPFASIEELRYLLGMTPSLFERMSPYLTLYSGRSGIDERVAPPALQKQAAQGGDGNPGRVEGAPNRPAPSPPRVRPKGAYHIHARPQLEAGGAGELEVVVRIDPGGGRRYQILSWRESRGGSDERDT